MGLGAEVDDAEAEALLGAAELPAALEVSGAGAALDPLGKLPLDPPLKSYIRSISCYNNPASVMTH